MTTKLEEKFIEMYNNTDISVRKIKKTLKLSDNEYKRLRNRLNKDNLIQIRGYKKKYTNKTKRKVKHYSRCFYDCAYQIRRKGIYYGCCKTEKQAKRMVELFEENNWDIELKDEIKEKAIMEFPK